MVRKSNFAWDLLEKIKFVGKLNVKSAKIFNFWSLNSNVNGNNAMLSFPQPTLSFIREFVGFHQRKIVFSYKILELIFTQLLLIAFSTLFLTSQSQNFRNFLNEIPYESSKSSLLLVEEDNNKLPFQKSEPNLHTIF